MSTNLEYREKEKDRKKEKVEDRPAKFNEKKSDRELEREIKTEETFFEHFVAAVRKWGKVKKSGSEKKINKRTRTTFPPKNV